jgi:tetratricopeptide (TPR) repeat protein
MAIYQDVVDQRGLDTEASPRLAWAYVRLGQEQQARELLDKLLEARADDADVHFIDGSFWFNRARESPVAAARTAVAWERALELDPNFKGYEGITAAAMQKQVAQLKSRLPKSPARMVREAEAQEAAESSGAGEGGVAAHGGQMPGGGAMGQMPAENEEEGAEPDAGASDTATAAPAEPDTGVADTGSAESKADAGAEEEPTKTPVPILLTRADMALNQGELDRAESIYGKVLDREEGNIDARIGLVRLDYKRAPEDGKIVQKVRRIAESDRLTASQAYDLGLFADVKLGETELARELWEKVRALDADYADRLGLE